MRLQRGAAATALSIVVAVSSLPAQQPVPFTTSTNLVVVPVVVVDGKGATVHGLTAEDFRVAEDGKPVEISSFVPPPADGSPGDGRFIVLALDNLQTHATLGLRMRNIARQFVDRMGPTDILTVISINGGRATTTTSKSELRSAIDRFMPAFGDDTWLPGTKAEHGLKMINSLSEQAAKAPHRRKVLVFIGNSWLFAPQNRSAFAGAPPSAGMSLLNLSPEWDDAIRGTARNNMSVYTIDPAGVMGPTGDWAHSFTEQTGGAAWARSNNYAAAIDRIWHESASYYLLGYALPINDLKIHAIDVKVARPGVTVRARRARG